MPYLERSRHGGGMEATFGFCFRLRLLWVGLMGLLAGWLPFCLSWLSCLSLLRVLTGDGSARALVVPTACATAGLILDLLFIFVDQGRVAGAWGLLALGFCWFLPHARARV